MRSPGRSHGPVRCSSPTKTRSRGAMAPRSPHGSQTHASPGSTHPSSGWRRPTRLSATRPGWKTSFCPRWRISRRRCATCMRSSAARAFGLLFFLSGATGLVYELLWVRVLYQTFGSTIQSVTTVVAAYMGGLGLGAWLLGRRADRHETPAALYGWLEIAIGVFGLASPFVLALAHRLYVGTATALALAGAPSVALRFALAGAVLLIPTTLMGGTLPVLTRAFTGTDPGELQRSLGLLYCRYTLGAVVGTALAGFFLIEYVGVRASLWGTAAVNLAIGIAALRLPVAAAEPGGGTDPGRKPGGSRDPVDSPSPLLRRAALVLLGVPAFAALLYDS